MKTKQQKNNDIIQHFISMVGNWVEQSEIDRVLRDEDVSFFYELINLLIRLNKRQNNVG